MSCGTSDQFWTSDSLAQVREDLELALSRLVPASWNHDGTFRHTAEGDDDMPGHVKCSLLGPDLTLPVRRGGLALGEWQW